MKITVIIADDHPIVLKGMKELISKMDNFELLGSATNGQEVVRMCLKWNPDIVLLDIAMPELNGIEAAKQIREHCPATKIVLASMYLKDDEYLREAIALKVDGFVDKSESEENYPKILKAIMNGKAYISPEIAKVFLNIYQNEQIPASSKLSKRETEILKLVISHNSNQQIAETLFLSTRTIEKHRENMHKKLGTHSKEELIKFAKENHLI
ncbi:response regulator transcription factor [Deltaproteobacteria bacterium TL4]